MTTTGLIDLLKKYEHGGVTGRPREIELTVNGIFIPYPHFYVDSTDDGLLYTGIRIGVIRGWNSMTTTGLIDLLKKYERGEVTGRSREITLDVTGTFVPYPHFYVDSTDDTGICIGIRQAVSGMGLIERHWFENEDVPENYERALEDAVMLKKQEAKEPVIARAIPLGHGEAWGYWFKCSSCGCEDIHESAKNFCPNCGKKLEVKDD